MEQYRYSEQEQAILESLQQPLAVFQMVDKRIVTLAVSNGFCALLGTDSHAEAYAAMNGDTFRNVYPDDVSRLANAVYRFVRDGGVFDAIYRLKDRDGAGYRMIHAMGRHVFAPTGARLAHMWYTDEGLYTEAGDRQGTLLNQTLNHALHEESILKANYYDYLTGLPSMTYFFDLAEAGKEAIIAEGGRPVLLYMDMGGMKYFNTRYGFAEGDALLRSFAAILSKRFGNDHCSHFGSDHFVAYTREAGLEDALHALFEECAHMNGGNALPVRVGIYADSGEAVHVSTACDRAKIACDVLKSAYASCFNYYDRGLQDEAEKRQYILANLDRAIEERWIKVYYQPIVRASNGLICDMEALSRWIDPVRGFLSPADFIPALEEAGTIYKLDLYVLEQTLNKLREIEAGGYPVVPQSINLSRSDFDACDIVEEIRSRVDAAGICRDKITIEITEGVIGSDFKFMRDQVRRFQALGFPVWMDDFGSGYSSLDALQGIKFDLLKFDMSFMRRLDESDSGRVILTELMKMAAALSMDTVCEGVETEAQARFLQEIGCSKLQGYYYDRPKPVEQLMEQLRQGGLSYENPAETAYYDAIGGVNLFDLAVISNEDEAALHNTFSTLPMGVIEVNGEYTRFVRSNQSYRDFVRRFFGFDLSFEGSTFARYTVSFMRNVVRTCCEQSIRSFYDEKMPDGSVVHSFARRISVNPVTGSIAVAIAVLSITDPGEGETYADIARALAADFYNIYVVDLDTERFIEYTSSADAQELAMERHGTGFFASARQDTMTRIYREDRDAFLAIFTKENIVRELDAHGVFTATYRLVDTGKPLYASMKVTRMAPDGNRIIMGISIIDAQVRQREEEARMRQEAAAFARIAALSGNYIVIYSVDPETGRYVEYSASREYADYGLAREGEDFFTQLRVNAPMAVLPEDLPMYLRVVTRENILGEARRSGLFALNYRLVLNGSVTPVSLRAALVREHGEEVLIVGVNTVNARAQG